MKASKSSSRKSRSLPAFTLVELLVTISIIAVLATLAFTGSTWVMRNAKMSTSLANMRQLATGTILYSQDHNGLIPRGDDSADGKGSGGRGIIWINHIAASIGYPELDPDSDPPPLMNQSREGMDQWTYLIQRYGKAPFVCQGFSPSEIAKAKLKTRDAMGGIGYNVQPLLASEGGTATINASWGAASALIPLSKITHESTRCMYASSYDWHLFDSASRAYHRFGRNKAAMVFWDGSSRIVNSTEYDKAINTPDLHISK